MIRALGAPRIALLGLLLADALVVFGGGFAVAVSILFAVRSIFEGFMMAAFGVKPALMSAAFHPSLLLAVTLLGLLSVLISVFTATRQAPLVTLEAPRD